jgi:hypothetical protein
MEQTFWADANIIGKQIRMNGQPYTVVGVLPAGMYDRLPMELWVPLGFKSEQLIHDAHFLLVMARLKDWCDDRAGPGGDERNCGSVGHRASERPTRTGV